MNYKSYEEYIKLPWVKQMNMLTSIYMFKSNIPMFVNKKMNSSYFKLRSFFMRQDNYKSIYVFLYNTDKEFTNLTEMFKECNMYYEKKKFSNESVVEAYKPISLDDIMNL